MDSSRVTIGLSSACGPGKRNALRKSNFKSWTFLKLTSQIKGFCGLNPTKVSYFNVYDLRSFTIERT